MNNRETKDSRKKWVGIYKISMGCQRCGRKDIRNPAALCFDHLDEFEKHEAVKNGYSKRSNAGGMFNLYGKKYPISVLMDEIKKCRVLCQVCHMEVTHPNYELNPEEPIDSLDKLENKLISEENDLNFTQEQA